METVSFRTGNQRSVSLSAMERVAYERMAELQGSHWWFSGRRAVLTRLIGQLPLPKSPRILEAGCGVGGNLAMLQSFGTVSALEPDADSRRHVLQTQGVTAKDGALPSELPWKPGSFDLTCAFDVIEHVEDDAGAIRALADMTAPGGRLVVTVPAYRWLWSRHDDIHHHKRRYRRSEMKALFEAAGLKIEKASYFNTLLFPLAAAVRLLGRLFGAHGGADTMPPAPVNALFSKLFAAEAGWVAKSSFPFGLSIVVIGKKV